MPQDFCNWPYLNWKFQADCSVGIITALKAKQSNNIRSHPSAVNVLWQQVLLCPITICLQMSKVNELYKHRKLVQ